MGFCGCELPGTEGRDALVAASKELPIDRRKPPQELKPLLVLLILTNLISSVGLAASQASVSAEREAQKTVLVIHASRRDAPYAVLVESAIRKTLVDALGERLDYYTEYIDFARFSGSDYQIALRDFLHRKYAGWRFHVIITDGNAPSEFVARYRSEIFPGAPIVFSTEEEALQPMTNSAGLFFSVDLKSTLDIALKLQPNMKRVFVIHGVSEFDRFYEEFARQQFREYEDRLELIYLPPMSMKALLEKVTTLPNDSLVYFVSLFEDATGNRFIPADVLQRLASVANAPVYCWPELTLGSGIVGGHLLSEEKVGQATGELALRILRGENPDQMLNIQIRPYVNAFDWRQLRRWGIKEDHLPPGSAVLFREESFFKRYRAYVLSGLFIFTTEFALILGLLAERAWRRRAERDAQRVREALAHLGRVSAMGELAASIAHELSQPLGAIRTNAEAASSLLKSEPNALTKVKEILHEIAEDDKRAADVIQRVRTLVSKRVTERVRIDMNEVVEGVTRFITNDAMHRHVSVETELAPMILMVEGDGVELQQVILNLLLNALEAASSNHHARVSVSTNTTDDGELVHVVVRDNGRGLAPGSEAQVFDPFYTTKETGMGMGLTIARSIVEAHRGRIWARKVVEGGAEFHFTLPRSAKTGRR